MATTAKMMAAAAAPAEGRECGQLEQELHGQVGGPHRLS